MTKHKKSGWRYQAVYNGDDDELRTFSICEVYLDKNGKLETWTENSSIAPSGWTLEELTGDLRLMLNDISRWKPVLFDSLQIGMIFDEHSNTEDY